MFSARVAVFADDLADPGLSSLGEWFDKVIWVHTGRGPRADVVIPRHASPGVTEQLAALVGLPD